MRRELCFATAIAAAMAFAPVATSSTISGTVCVVKNPNLAYANLRASPEGEKSGTIQNGSKVELEDWSVDSQKKVWARLKGGNWIYFNYLDCAPAAPGG